MDSLRSTAHLQRELGDGLFNPLVSSDNTERVRWYCRNVLNLPPKFTVGRRTYLILPFKLPFEFNEVPFDQMIARAKNLDAHQGEDHLEWLMDRRAEVTAQLGGYYPTFAFTAAPCVHPDHPKVPGIKCMYWTDEDWTVGHLWSGIHDIHGETVVRVLRHVLR